MDIEVLPGVEDASGVEKEEEKDGHKAQPVDVVETLGFGGWRRICAHKRREFLANYTIFSGNGNLRSAEGQSA
jgi:hypothetical protein